jgi:hypothetical protein
MDLKRNNMKQTAVEWLFLQMENLITKAEITNMDGNDFIIAKVKLLQEAKEMEKKDKHSEYMRGWKDGYSQQEPKSE